MKKLVRIWCDSRVVRSIGYDPVNQLLEVELRGRDYRTLEQYSGPDPATAMAFVAAPSKAAFYYIQLHGRFPVRKVPRDSGVFEAPPWRAKERDDRQQQQAQLWGYQQA